MERLRGHQIKKGEYPKKKGRYQTVIEFSGGGILCGGNFGAGGQYAEVLALAMVSMKKNLGIAVGGKMCMDTIAVQFD